MDFRTFKQLTQLVINFEITREREHQRQARTRTGSAAMLKRGTGATSHKPGSQWTTSNAAAVPKEGKDPGTIDNSSSEQPVDT
ncbi:Hypothetical predicted protein, partial [Drosophila guanche]